MLKITRQPHGYTAYFISRVGIFPCIGVRDPEANAQLQEAFRRPAQKTVQSLRRDPPAPPWSPRGRVAPRITPARTSA